MSNMAEQNKEVKRIGENAGAGGKLSIKNSENENNERPGHDGNWLEVSDENTYECSWCKKKLIPSSDLFTFEQDDIDGRRLTYGCTKCAKSLIMGDNLESHEKNHTEDRTFKCSYCEKGFKRKSHLVRHEKIHTREKPSNRAEQNEEMKRIGEKLGDVVLCGKSFIKNSDFETDECVANTSNWFEINGKLCYECSNCEEEFISNTNLLSHALRFGERPQTCGLCTKCGKTLKGKNNLESHKRNHTKYNLFECSYCEKTFTCKSHLKRHERIHTGEKPYKCSHCEMSFIRKDYLVNHLKIHKVDKACTSSSYCENNFMPLSHEMVHTGETPPNLAQRNKDNEEVKRTVEKLINFNDLCRTSVVKKNSVETDEMLEDDDNWQEDISCDKKIFPYESSWCHEQDDIGESHPPDGSTRCGVRLTEESNLVKRERSDSNDQSFNYSCHEESFIRKHHLVNYERKGKTWFKCSYCEENFIHKYLLERHEKIHTGEKPFKCSQCEKTFTRLNHLKNHRTIHTGERPFKCSQCEMSFRRKDYLVNHLKNHQVEKLSITTSYFEKNFLRKNHLVNYETKRKTTFTCSYCEKKFTRKSHLECHERIHTGEKPFKCSHCEMSFRRKDYLANHLYIHIVDNPCNSSENNFTRKSHRVGQEMVNTGKTSSNLTERNEENKEVKRFGEKLSDNNDLCRKSAVNTSGVAIVEGLGGDDNWLEDSDMKILPYESSWYHEHHLVSYERKRKSLFKCSYCEKKFTCKYYLERHERIHTGERPFKCSYCEMSFIRKDYLKKHLSIHTVDKLCNSSSYYGNNFIQKSNLIGQEMVHTGETSRNLVQRNKDNEEVKRTVEKLSDDNDLCRKSVIKNKRVETDQRLGDDDNWLEDSDKKVLPYDRSWCHEQVDIGESRAPDGSTRCGVRLTEESNLVKRERSDIKGKSLNYSCRKKRFIRKRRLASYDRKPKRPFKCSYCEKKFTSKSNVECHERIHTGERPFKCSHCERSFIRKDFLVNHLNIHKVDKPCNSSENNITRKSLRVGQEMVNTGKTPPNLADGNKNKDKVKRIVEKLDEDNDLCRKSVENTSGVEIVERLGDDDNWLEDSEERILPNESSWCHEQVDIGGSHPPDGSTEDGARLIEESNLMNHERSDINGKSLDYSCHKKRSIRKHRLASYDRKRKRPFKCPYCEKKFTSKSNLECHERIHTGERPFKCSHCEMSFIRKDYLVNHLEIHKEDKPCNCSYCGKSISRKGLAKHEAIHDRPFKCSSCEKGFIEKFQLLKHERIHNSPFKCSHCEKKYLHKSHLKRHERIHTGERPFKCTYCEMSFTRKDCLVNHLKIHKADKPFKSSSYLEESFIGKDRLIVERNNKTVSKCSYCEKSFSRKDHLIRHERIHNKPFKCSSCEKNFYRKDQLVAHLKIHTVDNSFKCTFCDETFSEMGDLVKHELVHCGQWPSYVAEENNEYEELGDDDVDI